jgi:hypothetical protein
MAKAFQPNVAYYKGYKHIQFAVPTYAEVKKNMKTYLSESEGKVSVYRHRRGEWGEWFEHWELSNGKPTIVKEGWQ